MFYYRFRNDVARGPPQGAGVQWRFSPFSELQTFEEAKDNLCSARKLQLFWCPSHLSLMPLFVDQQASILYRYSPHGNLYTNLVKVKSDPRQRHSPACIFPGGEEIRRIFSCADIQDVQIIASWAAFRASPEWISEICSRSSLWRMSRVETQTSSTFAQTSCACSFPRPSAATSAGDGGREVGAIRSCLLWQRQRMGRDKHG